MQSDSKSISCNLSGEVASLGSEGAPLVMFAGSQPVLDFVPATPISVAQPISYLSGVAIDHPQQLVSKQYVSDFFEEMQRLNPKIINWFT